MTAAMPPDDELGNGCVVMFSAVDATTGVDVAGVLFTDGMLYVDVREGDAAQLAAGSFMYVPGPAA